MFDQYSTNAPKGIIDTIKQGSPLIFSLTYDFQKDLKLHYDKLVQLSCFQREACRKSGMASFQCHNEYKEGMSEQLPI